MSALLRLRVGSASDPGKVRTHNEDAMLADGERALLIVADGMGGHKAGDVASKMAVATITEAFESTGGDQGGGRWALFKRKLTGKDRLVDAIKRANRVVLDTAKSRPECKGMGTTVIAACIEDGALHFAHVGDSRLYRLRQGELEQLTADHSLLNEYLRLGVIKAENAGKFPYKNIIVRALGLSPSVDVDAATDKPQVGDRYLLCTDGLTDLVNDARIGGQLERSGDPDTIAAGLIELALAAGGLDNVTAVVADVIV